MIRSGEFKSKTRGLPNTEQESPLTFNLYRETDRFLWGFMFTTISAPDIPCPSMDHELP
ncbi:hypothetical protein BgiMline_016321, partial [Biomphalaria glabrata]